MAAADSNWLRIWFISDTHNHHDELDVPQGIDVVIHCGDESDHGNAWLNLPEAREFFNWYSRLDVPTKLYIPGNHSTAIEHGLIRPDEYPDIRFLIHQQTELSELVVFGSPYTPEFFKWAYMRPREKLDIVWQSIPDDVDILITHGPPKGYLDVTRDLDTRKPIHVGSMSLTRHVKNRIKPLVHSFGHIHDEREIQNFGVQHDAGIMFINCSCCNLGSRLVNHGIVIEIDTVSKKVRGIIGS
jgi:predicted phosphohydrolase